MPPPKGAGQKAWPERDVERRDRATSTRMTSNSKIALTVVGIPAASFADNPSGCDFAANGIAEKYCRASLPIAGQRGLGVPPAVESEFLGRACRLA